MDFEKRVNQIYDHLYANAPIRTPQGIAYEVGKLFNTLSFIEQEDGDIQQFTDLDASFFQQENPPIHALGGSFRKSFSKMNRIKRVYPAQEQIRLSDFDIFYSISRLHGITLLSNGRDYFGDAIEVFRSNWVKTQGGQFFTDQRVTQLAITLLEFDPENGDDLVDICAGTGGFLLAALNHIQNKITSRWKGQRYGRIRDLAKHSLKGQEIDPELADIANVTLSSRLGTKVEKFILTGDSVGPTAFSAGNNTIKFDSHFCAATNPPFGTKITIKDPKILSGYELSYASSDKKRPLFPNSGKITPRAPDTLFIEQNIKLLKPGIGRLAIVVPYQIVSGPQAKFIREWILKNAQVLAVVDLPPETFQPHTGTKASLLVLRRRKEPLVKIDTKSDPPIFMARPKWIGHDRRGNSLYKKEVDGSLTNEILTDFPEIEEAFMEFRAGSDPGKKYSKTFIVDANSINAQNGFRLDAQANNPNGGALLFAKNGRIESATSWKTAKVKDLVERIFYPGRFKREYTEDTENSVPFLGGTNISQLLLNTEKRISKESPNLEQLRVEAGWVLITRSGSTGIAALVPPSWEGYAISEHVIRIVPNPKRLPSEYLYAFFKTRYAQEILAQGVYGSVIDEITPEFIGEIEIPIPKESRVLNNIASQIHKGEQARQEAIEGLSSGINTLSKILGD